MILEEMKQLSKEDQKILYEKLKDIRSKAKIVNFASLYSVSAKTLSRNSGMPLEQCEELLRVYWKKNKAVKDFVETCKIKTIENQMWVFNPISKLWYSLRNDRDIFSTVNQGSAVWCFDTYIAFIRKLKIKILAQFHDEVVLQIGKHDAIQTKKKLEDSMKKVNNYLKLNVNLGCSVDFGSTYSEIH